MSVSKTKLILKCRNELIDIHRSALEAIKPENLIKNSIQVAQGNLVVKSRTDSKRYDLADTRIHVIGGGKSVMAMAMGLAEVAKRSNIHGMFSHGCLSIPLGLESSIREKTLASVRIKCHFGSKNNLPDQASVEASRNILKAISDACESDKAQRQRSLFIVLISGGGSACLTSPRYVSLSQKLEMIKFLVQKGANIVELNKVRRFYSNIKGGALARYILSRNPNSRVLSLILSDVIGDPIEFIASGPTHLSSAQTTRDQWEQAHQVLSRYGYSGPVSSLEELAEKDQDHLAIERGFDLINHIIGNNQIAIDAATHKAQALGYEVINLGSELQGNTNSVVDKLVSSARGRFGDLKVGRVLALGGGEATVEKADNETWGEGGRAQEMALDYLTSCLNKPQLEERGNAIDMLLAGTTDGQDGPTDVGACLASHAEMINDNSVERIDQLKDALKRAKTSHDSYNFWKSFKPDWLVKTGLTGTNVMDLYMYSLTSVDQQCKEASRL